MLYVIKRDDEVVSLLDGPEELNLLALETQWIESKAVPTPSVEVTDLAVGATCKVDAYQLAKAANRWEDFEHHLTKNGVFKKVPFREYETLMRMNHNGLKREGKPRPDVCPDSGRDAANVAPLI